MPRHPAKDANNFPVAAGFPRAGIATDQLPIPTSTPNNTIAGWAFTRDELRLAVAGELLLNPSMDLSNPCNLNCAYCFVEEKDSERKIRMPHELSEAELLGTLDSFAAAGAMTVNIVGAGEPTIDPSFATIARHATSLGLRLVVFTNGIRLSTDTALVHLLYRLNATIVLKYNAIDAETQDLVAGRDGYAIKRNAALDALMDAGFAGHLPTRLGLDIMAFRGNVGDIPQIHRMCRANNIFPIVSDFIPAGRTRNGAFQGVASINHLAAADQQRVRDLLQPLTGPERLELRRTLLRIDEEFGVAHAEPCAYYGGAGCTQLLGLYVDISGAIWPCVAKEQLGDTNPYSPLGHLRRGDDIATVWRTHPYMHRLRSHYNGGCPYKPSLYAG